MSYLLYAVWEHNYDMTKFLLEKGADPNTVSSLTSTPDVIEPRLPLEISCYDDYGMNYMKLLREYGLILMIHKRSVLYLRLYYMK